MLVRIQGRRQFSLSDSYHFSMQLNTNCSSHMRLRATGKNGVPNVSTRGFAGARSGGKRAAAAHVGHMAAYVARSSDRSQSIWHAL
jgi:hypothetical protein